MTSRYFSEEILQNNDIVRAVYALQSLKVPSELVENIRFLLSKLRESPSQRQLLLELSSAPSDSSKYRVSFKELLSVLANVRFVIDPKLDTFIFHRSDIFPQTSQDVAFGTNPSSPAFASYTKKRLQEDLDDAFLLIEVFYEALSISLPPTTAAKLASEKDIIPEISKPSSTDTLGGIPAPIIKSDTKTQEGPEIDKKKKKQDEERKKIEEIKDPTSKKVLLSNHLLRKEVLRIQNLLINQMLAQYGVPENKRSDIAQELQGFVTPIILFELQSKDSAADITNALLNTQERYNLYLSTLLRLRQSAEFQAVLLKNLGKNALATKKDISAQAIAQQLQKTEQQTLKQQKKDSFVSAEEANQIAAQVTITHENFEALLRERFRKAGLSDASINQLLLRLERAAITRSNLPLTREEDLDSVFKELFSDKETRGYLEELIATFGRQGNKNESWQQWLSEYFLSAQRRIYKITNNASVFIPVTSHVAPQSYRGIDEELAKDALGRDNGPLGSTYRNAVTLALYKSSAQLETIQDPHLKEQAQSIKKFINHNLQEFSKLSKIQKRRLLRGKLTTWEKFSEEIFTYQEWYTLIETFVVTEEIYFEELEYLQPDFQQFALENDYNTSSFLHDSHEQIQKKIGHQVLLALIAGLSGGASIPQAQKALETLDKIQQGLAKIPIVGEIANKMIDDAFKRIGKIVEILLGVILGAALAAIAAVAAFLAQFAGIAQTALSIMQLVGLNAAHALGALSKSILGGAVGGAKTALSSIPTALGTPSAIAASGLTIASIFTIAFGVVDIVLDDNQESAYILNGRAKGGIASEGCWPLSGYITGLDYYCGKDADKKHLRSNDSSGAIDIGVLSGTSVYSPFEGQVQFFPGCAGFSCGYGNYILLQTTLDGSEVTFVLAHLSDETAGLSTSTIGEWSEVNAGDEIGISDNTGRSTGPHLHFEIRGASFEEVYGDRYKELVCYSAVTSECSQEKTISESTENVEGEAQ